MNMSVVSQANVPLNHLPSNISESSKVQIADNAQWLLLLRIINVNSILCRNGINHSIRESEG